MTTTSLSRHAAPAVGLLGLMLGLLSGCERTEREATAAASAERAAAALASDVPIVTVYKTSVCPCCKEWVEHLRASGLKVEAKDVTSDELAQIRDREGVSPALASCHTSKVAGYVLEGHVPADLIQTLLQQRPNLRALAVPGMPAGVPGMPEAGPDRAPYEIVALQKDGMTRTYATR